MFKFYVLVLHGNENFDRIEKLFSRVKLTEKEKIIFIQNKLNCNFPVVPNSFCIAGTNKLREFSGFDESIAFVENNFQVKSNDIFILMNDTIFRSFNLIDRVFSGGLSNLEILGENENSAIVPVVVEVGDIKIFDEKMDRLFSTFFIALSYGLIKKIGGISVDIKYGNYLANEHGEKLFIDTGSKSYNYFYNNWLGFGVVGGVGSWPSSVLIPCNPKNFQFLHEKAKMILLETHFSVRLKKHEVNIIDLYQRSALIQFLRINLKRLKKLARM